MTPSAPAISIITPSLNQGAFLGRALESVLSQGIEGIEYTLVDGGSTDTSRDIINSRLRKSPTVFNFTSEPDKGHSDAINKGIARTRAPIVGWLNSDDVYYPGALQSVLTCFEANPSVDIVYGNANMIDEQDALIAPYPVEPWNQKRLINTCIISQPAAFVRRSALERFGMLSTAYRSNDYELWLRYSLAGARFAYLPKLLAATRIHPACATAAMAVRCHEDINNFMLHHLGHVPRHWLSYYARAVARQTHPDGLPRSAYLATRANSLMQASRKWPCQGRGAIIAKSLYWRLLAAGLSLGLPMPLTREEKVSPMGTFRNLPIPQ